MPFDGGSCCCLSLESGAAGYRCSQRLLFVTAWFARPAAAIQEHDCAHAPVLSSCRDPHNLLIGPWEPESQFEGGPGLRYPWLLRSVQRRAAAHAMRLLLAALPASAGQHELLLAPEIGMVCGCTSAHSCGSCWNACRSEQRTIPWPAPAGIAYVPENDTFLLLHEARPPACFSAAGCAAAVCCGVRMLCVAEGLPSVPPTSCKA